MSNEHILIVEDNEKNRKLVRDILQFKGFKTLETDTAEEGLVLARHSPPALILMDVQLPGMNGIDALAHLRADPTTQKIPVIAITASVMPDDKERILAAGFDGYQTKPISINEFLNNVDAALNKGKGGAT